MTGGLSTIKPTMKLIQSAQPVKLQYSNQSHLFTIATAILLTFSSVAGLRAGTDDTRTDAKKKAKPDGKETAKVEQKAEKPPPLPLHEIEGNGGIFSTLSAYLVNPPRNGEPLGRPATGFAVVSLGHGQTLEAFTLTETPWERLELGFGADLLQLGDLPGNVSQATGGAVHLTNNVELYNFNARLQVLKEGEFNQKWLPALTFGVHYKFNDTTDTLNQELNGGLSQLGVKNNQGVDFTLYATKLITFLPRPVLINVGGRATESAWIGLLGFTNTYTFVFEGNIAVFLTDRLALAAEFRQLPHGNYTADTPFITPESNWETVDLAYVINSHWTIAAGWANFGNVLNHNDSGVWGVTTKYEF